ncbi:MAG: DUF3769 domain-containing protein [Cyanothece sp. SIO1E1]|nr:DUF3769 domain-containing protein [Cyanothece sp. SIO1E1]
MPYLVSPPELPPVSPELQLEHVIPIVASPVSTSDLAGAGSAAAKAIVPTPPETFAPESSPSEVLPEVLRLQDSNADEASVVFSSLTATDAELLGSVGAVGFPVSDPQALILSAAARRSWPGEAERLNLNLRAQDSPDVLVIPVEPDESTPLEPGSPAEEEDVIPSTPVIPGEEDPTSIPLAGVIELTADRQQFDEQRRIFTAQGNVVMRFNGAVLDADRLQVNIPNRIAVAEGNVALTRGEQVLRGERFEYDFVQEAGTVFGASGEIFLGTVSSDFSSEPLSTDVSAGLRRPVSDRIRSAQPLQNVDSSGNIVDVGVGVGSGGGPSTAPGGSGASGTRIRFEAAQIEFDPTGWQAQNVRITNDPFSPPELELRASQARLTRISAFQDEIVARRARLVFDQGFALPLLRSRVILDRRPRSPGLFNIRFDGEDRGGLFIERPFEPISTQRLRVSVTPQFFLQEALTGDDDFFDLSSFGVVVDLDADVGPKTKVDGRIEFTTLDLGNLNDDPDDPDDDDVQGRIQALRLIGRHQLSLEASVSDRLFNGSLGFQTVDSSIGALLISPTFSLGNTGLNLTYQLGAQFITADTDFPDLLDPGVTLGIVGLGRFQASTALSRGFNIWTGKPLPPTATEGLRYTPQPLVPFVQFITGFTGVASFFTSNDTQETFTGTVGFQGQVGHLSRNFLDFTGFNIFFSQSILIGESPFLFDRDEDLQVLSLGIRQQIFGPILFGFQTALNLDTGETITSEFSLEYSRRTYGVSLSISPQEERGSLNLRISDFNFSGNPGGFGGSSFRRVRSGVTR